MHKECRNKHTKHLDLASIVDTKDEQGTTTRAKAKATSNTTSAFCFKTDCLYCAKRLLKFVTDKEVYFEIR